MNLDQFNKRLEEIAEHALEAHEVTSTAMILEQSSDMADKLYTIGNAKRKSIWVDLVLLDKARIKEDGEAADWMSLSKRQRKCIRTAKDLSFYSLLIEDFLSLRGNKDEFVPELDGLQDRVTTDEFELQYNMIKLVPKSRRGW